MIRIIGLSNSVFDSIIAHNFNVVKNYDQKMNMIEFIPNCSLVMNLGGVSIENGDNYISFLQCDYWRIEIE